MLPGKRECCVNAAIIMIILTLSSCSTWTGIGGFETRISSSSKRFDVDWLRMVSILGSPSKNILTGNAYTVGQFEGIFEGAFFVSHFSYY